VGGVRWARAPRLVLPSSLLGSCRRQARRPTPRRSAVSAFSSEVGGAGGRVSGEAARGMEYPEEEMAQLPRELVGHVLPLLPACTLLRARAVSRYGP